MRVSTGSLPETRVVQQLLDEAYAQFAPIDDGEVADYIPALARADRAAFGACVVGVNGEAAAAGDVTTRFSIQSVSKPFVFALVCQAIGHEESRRLLGANSTGMPFNSVLAIELNDQRVMNPMVNAGAMATTSLVPGTTAEDKWTTLQEGLSRFAGRTLDVDEDVFASESATNDRNRGIAHLLASYDHLFFDPDETTDLYTRQCSLLVTAEDLAVMAATVADGGVNPRTGERVIDEVHCSRTLAVMATAGMYERSGDWLFDIGLPGKSGVSGGMITIAPGKGGMGSYSPPLDEAGNSVRGTLLARFLSRHLGLDLFASTPAARVVDRRP